MPAVCMLVGNTPIAVVSGEKWSEVYEYAYETFINKQFLDKLRKWRYRGTPMWDGLARITLCRATEDQEKDIGMKSGRFLFQWLRIADLESYRD